jgi:hypothetical protein
VIYIFNYKIVYALLNGFARDNKLLPFRNINEEKTSGEISLPLFLNKEGGGGVKLIPN